MHPASYPPDVERRIADLERQIRELSAPRPVRRRRRVLVVLATLAIVIGLPMVAIASDTFADVPDSNIFHGDINRLYGSRITAGCGGGNFCPDTTVTRGQMAAFLNRGLGRLAKASVFGNIDGASTGGTLGSVTITANNVPGGTAFVQVMVTFNIYALETEQGTGCECELYFWLTDEADSIISSTIYADFDPRPLTSDDDNDLGVAVLGAQQVPTGVAKTYTLHYGYQVGTADFNVGGTMVATTYAFAGDGSNTYFSALTTPSVKQASPTLK